MKTCIRQIKLSCKYCNCNYAQTFCVDCFTPSQNWKLHAWITIHTIQLSTVFVTIHLNPITKPLTKKYLFNPRWQQFLSNNKNASNFFKCWWIFNFENSAGSYKFKLLKSGISGPDIRGYPAYLPGFADTYRILKTANPYMPSNNDVILRTGGRGVVKNAKKMRTY